MNAKVRALTGLDGVPVPEGFQTDVAVEMGIFVANGVFFGCVLI
jgi:hypothetical protein